ncbi:MAG: T9SS type A sorting domain-containing protein [Paludibacteraceae bacterium]|nr:T9SS type A sorting domain-containing protein [Paludibacteraceae bacterium]
MKKILLGLVMLVTAATMNAQIELEHVFNGWICVNEDDSDDQYYLKSVYANYNYANKVVEIYNSDFSLRSSFYCEDTNSLLIAENIFTADGAICYVVEKKGEIKIVHENGTIIKNISLPEGEGYHYIHQIGGVYKYIIAWYIYSGDGDKTYIYSCPGNGEVTTSVENVPAKVKRNAYPNPASDLVILPYDANGATSMKIYDMQGKLVERKFLDKNKQELQLNVKDYPSGMYFFEVNGESNSFIVE